MFSPFCIDKVVPAPTEINENGWLHSEGVGSSYLIFLHWWQVRVTLETICKVFLSQSNYYTKTHMMSITTESWILPISINTSGECWQKYTSTPKKVKHFYIRGLCTHIWVFVFGHPYMCTYTHVHALLIQQEGCYWEIRVLGVEGGPGNGKLECYTYMTTHRSIWDLSLDQCFCHRLESQSRHLDSHTCTT